jgi:uncharacterized protein
LIKAALPAYVGRTGSEYDPERIMLKNFRTSFMFFVAVACAGPVLAAADPTMDQVYQAVRAGEVTQAEQMMTQVLRDHPQSAKAHYVAAEVYARAGDVPTARAELGTAQRLEPGLPFARAQSVQALQRELSQGETVQTRSGYTNPRPPFSMSTVLLVLGGIFVLWLMFRRRTAPANGYPQYPGAMPAGVGGVAPGYGGPGLGSGLAGGLASGLAVGAGVVAGEELARHFLDRPGGALPGAVEPGPDNGAMGGNDFGVSDANSWDDGGSADGGDAGGGGDWS